MRESLSAALIGLIPNAETCCVTAVTESAASLMLTSWVDAGSAVTAVAFTVSVSESSLGVLLYIFSVG